MPELKSWFESSSGQTDIGDTLSGEDFKGMSPLIRETTQNAIDAKAETSDQPVRIEFELIRFQKDDVPGMDQYAELFKTRYEDKHHNRYYEERAKSLSKENFWVLRIGDWNTTGLDYCKENPEINNWRNLVLAQNRSSKTNNEGGSFGLGSGANLINSERGLVFYSSLGSKTNKFHFQGVGHLTTIPKNNEDGKAYDEFYSPLVYYGVDTQVPCTDIPNNKFKRRSNGEYGTDIYIIDVRDIPDDTGFIDSKDQLTPLAREAVWIFINNFAPAIKNKLITARFLENGKCISEIDNANAAVESIESILKSSDENFTPPKDEAEFIKKYFLDELTTKPVVINSKKSKIGDLYYDPKTSSCIAYAARQIGMKVDNPWSRYRFGNGGKYAYLIYITDPESNQLLRKLETPDHLSWGEKTSQASKQRSKPEFKRQDEIRQKVKELLKDVYSQTKTKSTSFYGLPTSRLLGDIENEENIKIRPRKIVLDSMAPKNIKSDKNLDTQNPETKGSDIEENVEGTQSSRNARNAVSKTNNTNGHEGNKTKEKKTQKSINLKSKITAIDPDQGIYYIKFTPKADYQKLRMTLSFIGYDTFSNPTLNIENVLAADCQCHCKDGIAEFEDLKAGTPIKVRITLKEKYTTTIEAAFNVYS